MEQKETQHGERKEMLYEVEKNQSSVKSKCLICHCQLSSKRNVLMHLHSAHNKSK